MNVSQEIAKRVESLPPEMQQQVLQFVESLSPAADPSAPIGEPGASLRQVAACLDADSARQMAEAIEAECERVDAGAW